MNGCGVCNLGFVDSERSRPAARRGARREGPGEIADIWFNGRGGEGRGVIEKGGEVGGRGEERGRGLRSAGMEGRAYNPTACAKESAIELTMEALSGRCSAAAVG